MWSLMDKIKFKPVCILMDFNHMRVWERKNGLFPPLLPFSSLCLLASGPANLVPGTKIFSVLVLLKEAFRKTRDFHDHR